VSGLFGTETVDLVATWVAAAVTIVVLGGLFGERRLFGWSQHLLAGLATGFLALIAIDEVIVPRLVEPIAEGGADRLELWLGLALVGLTAGAPWLPRIVSAVPISLIVGSLAAFALGGAVIGTVLPQLIAATTGDGEGTASTVTSALGAGVTALVLVGFLHGIPRGRVLSSARSAGRWLLVAGIGGWLGYLLLSRLVLLLDRIGFLLGDWLGVGR
jgi:hypothetical protein